MGFLFRILRMALPFFLFYILGKFFNFYVMVFRYQNQSRNRTGSDNRGPGGPGGAGGFNPGQSRVFHDPYRVLNCSRSSSDEEIKKSYRELIARYHPDRFVGMNLDDDFVKLASQKFQEIQSAYEEIRKARGF